MTTALASSGWTVERLHALPDDGNRYEIVDGELFVTRPHRLLKYGYAAGELVARLDPYAQKHRLGQTLFSPADIIDDEGTLVQPDVFVAAAIDGRPPRDWKEVRLLLAVEVLSEQTARADRVVKRRLYQRERVPEYWIVDLDARIVARWRPEDSRPEELDDRLEWAPVPGIEPLVIDLRSLFEKAVDGKF